MAWIVIRNWERFQHRDTLRSKERGAPSWIKDYTGQLHDDDYCRLTMPQRGLLHSLRLEYAQSAGRCPADTLHLSRRLAAKVLQKSLDALVHAGFVEIVASKPPAISAQPASLEEKRVDTPPNPPGGESALRANGDNPKARVEPAKRERVAVPNAPSSTCHHGVSYFERCPFCVAEA